MTFALKRALYVSLAAVAAFILDSVVSVFPVLNMIPFAVLVWSVPLVPGSWYLVLSDLIRQKLGRPKRNSYIVLAVFVAAVIVLGTISALMDGSFFEAYWFVYLLWWYCVLLVAILLFWKNKLPKAFLDRYKTQLADINQSTERTELK